MTRDALSWALSATVAGAAHLGLALFILDRIPPSAPPPPETEIMVDMIKVGQAQAQQPAQASAAAEAATGAAVEAQADSADAAQADRAEAAASETAQAAETDSASNAARETASAAAETDSTAAQPEQPVADRAAEQAQQAAATPSETAKSAARQQDTGPAPTAEPASAGQARAATTPRQTVATEAARTVRPPSPPSARAAPAASNQRIITGIAEADIPQKAAATPRATTPTPSTSVAPTTSAAAVLAPAPSPPTATTIAPAPSGGSTTAFSPAPSAQTSTVSAASVPSATAAPSTAPAATVSVPSAPAAPAAAQVLEDQPATPAAQALSVSRVPAFVERAVAEPTDQVRYGAIVDYLRDYRADAACFAALPTVSGVSGALELDTFGLQSETLASFTEGLAREAGLTPTTYQREITAAQCAALRFVTGLRDYPAFSLTIDLDQRDIPQQGYLIGDIRHFGDRIVHLLLVDDEGDVLVLDGFLRDRDAAQHFEVGPLTQTEEGVVTQQLLLALALPDTLPVLEAAVSAGAMPAEAFFSQLATELTPELEAATGLGLVAFAVGAP